MHNIDSVLEFHSKFGLPRGDKDVLSDDPQAIEFRLKFLQEELDELRKALTETYDRVDAFDALIDLTYVALGTALFMGVDPVQWRMGFAAVQAANMAKIRVETADQSKRGSSYDVVKPEGWVPPEPILREVLNWGNKYAMQKTNDI